MAVVKQSTVQCQWCRADHAQSHFCTNVHLYISRHPHLFPVASLSRSSRVGHPNQSIKVPWSDTELSNQVSVNAMRQASFYSLKKFTLPRSSSILRPFKDGTFSLVSVAHHPLSHTTLRPRLRSPLVLYCVNSGGKSMLLRKL